VPVWTEIGGSPTILFGQKLEVKPQTDKKKRKEEEEEDNFVQINSNNNKPKKMLLLVGENI